MAKKEIDPQAFLDAINRAYDDFPDQEESIILRLMRAKQRQLIEKQLEEGPETFGPSPHR
ncbi:MAG TPA: hypothetical protein VGM86_05900 [Thermoanaerobaculia bacterium]|jgi:Mg/Co/Ni transporter MgtE